MNRSSRLIPAGFTIALLCQLIGCSATNGGGSEGPLEKAVAQPLDDAASTIEKDYRQADEQHEDIIDKVFAPLDDTVSDFNREHSEESDSNESANDSAD